MGEWYVVVGITYNYHAPLIKLQFATEIATVVGLNEAWLVSVGYVCIVFVTVMLYSSWWFSGCSTLNSELKGRRW